MKIRHGVIGLGFFGEIHAEVLSGMYGVELAAVCTRRPDRLAAVADKFGVGKRYPDYRDLLADPEIDSVSITTHINQHAEIAVATLQSGKHVFLEKPMAGTNRECEAIVKAAMAAKGKFMTGHICRFDPRAKLAKEAIAAGKIGEIKSMHSRRNLSKQIGAEVLNKISPMVGDGIHDADLMLWFCGRRADGVCARNVRIHDYKYPDIGWAMFDFDNGSVGVVETAWCLPETTPYAIDARMEIIGTEGAIYIDCANSGLSICNAAGIKQPDTVYWPGADNITGALKNEFEYFFNCVRNDKTPDIITPEESKYAVELVLAAERSARENIKVKL